MTASTSSWISVRTRRAAVWLCAAIGLLAAGAVRAQEGGRTVYRCPGPPVLYTDALTPAEARSRDCRTIEGAPITVVQGPRRRTEAPVPAPGAATASGTQPNAAVLAAAATRPAEQRVDAAAQRARDTDSRRILETELRKEEEALANLRREFNNGEPERKGDERNFAKYQERVAEMRSALTRKEADIAALKRELAKLPAP